MRPNVSCHHYHTGLAMWRVAMTEKSTDPHVSASLCLCIFSFPDFLPHPFRDILLHLSHPWPVVACCCALKIFFYFLAEFPGILVTCPNYIVFLCTFASSSQVNPLCCHRLSNTLTFLSCILLCSKTLLPNNIFPLSVW